MKKERKRCVWVGTDPIMVKYHDEEWGRPVSDDRKHFEFLILEAAQAGLSWSIVLKKREGYRKAFADFDPVKVSKFSKAKIEKLILNPSIIRNRLKIEAAVHNAKLFLDVQKQFGTFNKYSWQFVNGKPINHKLKAGQKIPATSAESDAFSKDLKARGFKFVGSTIIYAHMQAVGMINDHLKECFCHAEVVKKIRK